MAKPEALDFLHLLYSSVVFTLVLVLAVVGFVVVHQRRAHALQARLRQQELEHQQELLRTIVASQEGERERIARDLHDEIGASLSAARLFVNQVQYETTAPQTKELAQRAAHMLGDTLQSVRHIVQNISPTMLEKFGFCRAVAVLADHLKAAGLAVELRLSEEVQELPTAAQLTLYRIVQEAFGNITKHARARCLLVELLVEPDTLRLCITDDGCGFAPEVAQAAVGIGLSGMQARARILGGQLRLESVPGSGTCIQVLVPR